MNNSAAITCEENTVVKKRMLSKAICLILLFAASLCFFAATWYTKTYGKTGFDSILFTLFSNLNGVQSGLIMRFVLCTIVPTALLTLVLGYFLFFFTPDKKFRFYPFKHIFAVIVSLVLSITLLATACAKTGFFSYAYKATHESNFYEERYVDPDSVNITFPENKRNLIYIFLESMETTFLSKEQGGALEHCTIPELYNLASENINFSHNEGVGGFLTPEGATWTVAALTAQTSGVPLKSPGFDRNTYGQDTFLPGITSLANILKDNGYYQAVMFGSDKAFANRDVYFESHGTDKVYDLYSAREDGIVPPDYHVWWGMEDKHLFTYAKQKLTEISQMEQPFAFTMLTVDTHHVAGYKCDLCDDTYEEQYDNVYSCSSRQVNEFVNWLKEQSFYENTTVIICGDHFTMDSEYIERNVDPEYQQHVYNCILNSAVTSDNYKNREFCGVDYFPTVLAALGCEIPGNRLGLGTNLFSDTPTLTEELGFEEFNKQVSLNSDYYSSNFINDPDYVAESEEAASPGIPE